MAGPTEELINPSGVIKSLLENEWANHNTLEAGTASERDVPIPDPIIDKERPPVGSSSRSLPKTVRAQPCMYVWDTQANNREKGDITGATEDYDSVIRAQIVVANGLDYENPSVSREGGETRDDYIWVMEKIRQANYAPPGGIAGSRWSNLHPGQIDRTPTEYSEQWRANIDFELKAHKVKT